jgi:hypothetical protein
MNTFDRRRVAVACAVTVIALPALWALGRDTATSGAPKVGAAGIVAPAAETAPSTTAYEPESPLFVGGDDKPTPPSVINVAVPPAPGANQALAKASFKRYAGVGTSVCTTLLAPDGARLKVTNLDNGQTTTCVNTFGMSLPAGSDIVLNTAVYILIGDLADAPVPVRLSW